MKAVLFSISFLLVFLSNAQTPVAYYPFNGNANDAAGSLNGTVNGAILTIDRFGNANSAYNFDGVDDAISFTGLPMTNTDNFTLMAWVNPAVFSSSNQFNKMIISLGPGSNGYNMGMGNNSGSGGGNELGGLYNLVAWLHSGSFFPSINSWYHVALVRDNGLSKFYFNGAASPNTSNANPNAFTTGFQIGGQDFDPTHFWNGKIDEVKIYDVALTAAQILQEYAASNQIQKPGSGNTLSFDGSDDGVEVSNSAALQFPGDFSAECWVKIPAAQNNTFNPDNAIMEKWGGNNAGIGYPFVFRFMRSSHSAAFARYNGATSKGVDGITLLDDNKWHHLMATKTGAVLNFYIDGILQGTDTDFADLSNVNNTQNLNIGTRGPIAAGPNNLTGSIDEIRIWNVGLSQTEIRDRMCHKITPSDVLYANLVAYYNFDEGTGTTLFDGTINANNGTLANGPAWITSGAHIGNVSAHNYTGAGSSINLINSIRGDAFTASLTTGSAEGIQLYCVTEAPNTNNGLTPIDGTNGYFGVFPINGVNNFYTAAYNYNGIPGITDENILKLFKRNDNAGTAWLNTAAALNTTANTLTATGQNTEYAVATDVITNITVSGALTGNYQTLKEAFDAINAGGGSGSVTITVNANTTETAQAVLNETGYTVQVVPVGNRIIEGNLNVAMILLNGADNVTFNGQSLSGTNTLTLRNTGTTTASVIRLLDAASNNTIKKCIIEGSSSGTSVTQGIVVITVTTLGNSVGNIIDSNLIRRTGPTGANIGIVLSANNTSATSIISNTQITNNSIENVFINNIISLGITLQNNCSNTLIKGNSVYNTLSIVNTLNGVTYNAIAVNTRGNTVGSGVTIDSNFVGGTSTGCGGSKMIISSPNNNFATFGIVVADNVNANTTSITRNTVKNLDINVTNPGTGTTNPLSAITVQFANLLAFNNNTVGDVTNNSITVTMKLTSTGAVGCFGMLIQTNCVTPIANNFVGGVNITSSSTGASAVSPFFVALDARNGLTNNIKNNTIGSAAGGNITVNNTALGVFNLQMISNSIPLTGATINIDSNTIKNVSASHSSISGITHNNGTAAATLATVTLNANSVTDIGVSGASGIVNCISYSTAASVANLVHTLTAKNNFVNNINGLFGTAISLRGIIIANASTAVNRLKGRIENNTVTNLLNLASTTTGFTRGISFSNDIVIGDSMVLASNTVNNIIDGGATLLTDPTVSSFGNCNGINVLMPNSGINGTAVIRDNTINTIVASATDNAAVKTLAISVLGNAAIIERNKIYDIQNAATSLSALLAPILLRSRNDDANISVTRNNMVAINNTTQAQIAGIRLLDGTVNANIYHNTILAEGSSAANSYALLKEATAIADVKNNIFYNAVNGAGTAYAIGLQTSTAGYTGNNNYLVSPGINTLAQVGVANHSLATWQATTAQDASAKTAQAGVNTNAVDLFINKTVANLFINTSNTTEPVNASNNGMALGIAVPTDFAGTLRNGSTPDIGAHEFIFTGPLPLTLLSFSGNRQSDDALLEWRTANEINVARFELQRSDDGRNFVTITIVPAGAVNYSTVDPGIFSAKTIVYYRLRSIDMDNRFTLSPIIKLTKQVNAIVTIFPNPVKDMVTITGLQQKGTLRLFAADGKLLQQQNVQSQSTTLDMSKLNAGTYILQYSNSDGIVSTQKIIKQ